LPEKPVLAADGGAEEAETIDVEVFAESKPPVAANDEKANGAATDDDGPPRMPDDPGVDPDAKQPSRRFKLF
jgi:uncharacterized membrane-anchored protein